MNKPRILIVENAVDITGSLHAIVRSSVGLRDNFDFDFVIPRNSRGKGYILSKGFGVHELPMREIRKDFFSVSLYFPILLANCFRLFRLVKRLKIDLIVSNDIYNLLPPIYKFFGGRIPFVVYVRFLPSKFPEILVGFWSYWNSRFASTTIAVSQAVKRELPYKEVICIGGELPEHERPYSTALSKRILYMANYIPGKGQDFALQSFLIVHKKYPDWKIRFIGGIMGLDKNKRFKEHLISSAKQMSLDHAVEWNDFEEDFASAYVDAPFVLNFSESESFSMTCLEAMYYGRPVVATKCGGPEEIIDPGETGLLVELGDIKAGAEAIDYLISHPVERERMGLEAYSRIREKFRFEVTIGKLKDVYDSALLK